MAARRPGFEEANGRQLAMQHICCQSRRICCEGLIQVRLRSGLDQKCENLKLSISSPLSPQSQLFSARPHHGENGPKAAIQYLFAAPRFNDQKTASLRCWQTCG